MNGDEMNVELSAEQRYLVQRGVSEDAEDTAKVLAAHFSKLGEGFPNAASAKGVIDAARSLVGSLSEAVDLLERLPLSDEESRAKFGGV